MLDYALDIEHSHIKVSRHKYKYPSTIILHIKISGFYKIRYLTFAFSTRNHCVEKVHTLIIQKEEKLESFSSICYSNKSKKPKRKVTSGNMCHNIKSE